MGAVASHKLVVGFCLGVELSSGVATAACKHFIAIAVFALGSVAGIIVGMTVTGMSSHWSDIAQPILQVNYLCCSLETTQHSTIDLFRDWLEVLFCM